MSEPSEREEAIFEHALSLDSAGAREAYLREVCGDDAAMRERLLGLISAHDRAGKFLEEPITGARASSPAALPEISGERADEAGRVPTTEKAGDRIGRYTLLEKIGEGGFGDVWMAEQEEPVRRRVALKIIKLGMDTRQVVARFEAERQALAMMDHPNIAHVFDAGVTGSAKSEISNSKSQIHGGRPYFVMELVHGMPMTNYCDQANLSTRERLELFGLVCRAVQHAHQKGIIHRDLKPSNILVTEQDGRPVPKVIDFGVAKAIEGRLTDKTLFTGFQQLLGTPTYMSPEQAGLGSLDVDTRSDIYSLGVLLYELLTSSTPFDTKELLQLGYDHLLRTIREVDPLKPSTRLKQSRSALLGPSSKSAIRNPQSAIDSDLDWIVMKALEKDRSRRYQTANALAMELERYLHDEPVLARPPSALYRCQKFARKHRKAVFAAAGFALLLVGATALSLGLAVWAQRERGRAAQAQAKSREDEVKAIDRLWEAYLAQARANRWSSRPGRRFDSLATLAKAAAIRPSIDLRNEAIACMTLSDLRFGRKLKAFLPTSGKAVDWSFERYAQSDDAGNISIRRVSDDEQLSLIPGPGMWAWNIVFSPDRQFLICTYHASGQDFPNSFRLWNLTRGETVLTLTNCWGGQFSPDRRRLVVHWRKEGSVFYDLTTLQEVRRVRLGRLGYPRSAFSRDGSLLAVSSLEDSDVRIVDVKAGRLRRKLSHPESVRGLDWHRNGRWLACACADGNVYLWDADAGQSMHVFRGHQMVATQVKFNHRGNLLLTSAWDSTARLWNLGRANQFVVLSAQRPFLQFSPDEKLAGLVEREKQYALLEINTAPEYRSLRLMLGTNQPVIKDAHISPDGRLLATGDADGVRIWDLSTDRELAFIPVEPVQSLAILPDQSGLVTCGEAGLFLWPFGRDAGAEAHVRIGPPRRLAPGRCWRCLTLDAGGRRLAAAQYQTPQATYPLHNLILELNSTNAPILIKGPSNQGAAALSPDGRWLATGIWRGKKVSIWNAHTGEPVCDLPVPDSAFFPKFSPDGRWLVAGTASSFHCWEAGTWMPAYDLAPGATSTSQPSTATFSPDGELIAVFHRYNRTHLIDASRGRVLATLDLDRHVPLCFSPDGGALVMATENGQLKVLDLRLIRQQLATMNLDWDMPPRLPRPPGKGPKRLVVTVVTNNSPVAAPAHQP